MSRISPGTLLLGVIAVMFGLLGAYVVRQNMLEKPVVAAPEEKPEVTTFVVPMANADLPAGRKITFGDLSVTKMTQAQLVSSKIEGPFMANTQQIIGRILKEDLPRGGTFTTLNLYAEGDGPSITNNLEAGMRAATINVAKTDAVLGFATPGSYVDVIFRSEEDTEEDLPESTLTLLEGVKILAINTHTLATRPLDNPQGRDEDSQVTLQVTPEEAIALRVVDGRGSLSLTLRHPEDALSAKTKQGTTLDTLLNRPRNKHTMEVFRGNNLSQVDFKNRQPTQPTAEQVAKDNADKQANADAKKEAVRVNVK